MCVIAIINQRIDLQSLKDMEESNPHGAGVAWAEYDKVRFCKGLSAEEIFDLQESGVLSYPYVAHFRWATSGVKSAEMAHPFVIGKKALSGITAGELFDNEELLFHNGVWRDYDKWLDCIAAPAGRLRQVSDTAVAAFFMDDVPELIQYLNWATVMVGRGEGGGMVMRLTGTWEMHEGNKFSNLQWLPRQTSTYFGWSAGADDFGQAHWSEAEWNVYLKRKYGVQFSESAITTELATEVAWDDENEKTIPDLQMAENMWDAQMLFLTEGEGEEREDPDIISEDFNTVNKYLERIAS